MMTEETNALFEALFGLEEIRELLRESAPEHNLNEAQKKKLEEKIDKIENSIKTLKKLG